MPVLRCSVSVGHVLMCVRGAIVLYGLLRLCVGCCADCDVVLYDDSI